MVVRRVLCFLAPLLLSAVLKRTRTVCILHNCSYFRTQSCGGRDTAEKSWSIGSEAGGEEVCAFNDDDVKTVDKIRLRWQICDGTEGFSETRSMRLKKVN